MQIVQINAVYETGSTGRSVMELDRAIRAAGEGSFVFCTNRSDAANGIYPMGTGLSRRFHGLMSRLTGLQGYFSFFATRRMLQRLDEIKPDVVHLHNLHGNYIHVNMLLDHLIREHIPTVVTLHDCWFFTGHCCHFLEDDCDRWRYGCGRCPARRKWNKSWFWDTSARVLRDRRQRFEKLDPLVIIGVSDWVTDACRESLIRSRARFQRIYNWIDLSAFRPPAAKPKNERPLILSVSQSWSAIKGLDDILSVAGERPTYRFVLIGACPRVKAPQNVTCTGPIIEIDQLVFWYQRADVLLHLSYQETFGKVIAEALACGTPAVVYDAAAMPELIGPGCGHVVKKGDWRAAGEAVDALIQTGHDSASTCRAFAESRFDSSALTEAQIAVYRSICRGTGPR